MPAASLLTPSIPDMLFNHKANLLSDMLGIPEDRKNELENWLHKALIAKKKMSIADVTGAMAGYLDTHEESFYIGYLIGALTHPTNDALPA